MPINGDGTAQAGLGGDEGYGEVMVPRSDDGSMRLSLGGLFADGLNYFGTLYGAEDLFVNTNGTVSFGTAHATYTTSQNAWPGIDMIAPFWSDVDTRLDGEGAESGAIWVDMANDTLSITWDSVGAYRRNAEVTNTFQLQLVDQGSGDFDIVFRYGSIDWSIGSGTEDVGARAGLAQADGVAWFFDEAGDPALENLSDSLGNTGVSGLWVYEMRGGAVSGLDLIAAPNTEEENTQVEQPPVEEEAPPPDTADGTVITGTPGPDLLNGTEQHDTLTGLDGSDTLIGEAGNDVITGGSTSADLRDDIYGGSGNDQVDAGYGNDLIRGDAGNDTLTGGFGADTVIGGDGNDVLTSQAWGDHLFGGNGNDFINGGFGYDRVNGGGGADVFFHLGVAGHGSDWIQDYELTEGDLLQFGGNASPNDFQVNFVGTPNAGLDAVDEAFVIYRPTGQILWALIDGADQQGIGLLLEGQVYDLL